MEDIWKIRLVPRVGLPLSDDGQFLVHTENGGTPHCVAVVCRGAETFVVDHETKFKIDLVDLMELMQQGTDQATIVTFQMFFNADRSIWPECYPREPLLKLLDLQAGASSSSSQAFSDDFIRPVECTGSDEEEGTLADPLSGDVEDESVTSVGDALLRSMKVIR